MGLGLGFGLNKSRKVASLDVSTQAVFNEATLQGYTLPSSSTQTYLNTLITTLKSIGAWDELDVLWVFATDGDSDFATLNLKAPTLFKCSPVNSPIFTSLEGFTGNGSTSYLTTGWNPAPNGS